MDNPSSASRTVAIDWETHTHTCARDDNDDDDKKKKRERKKGAKRQSPKYRNAPRTAVNQNGEYQLYE